MTTLEYHVILDTEHTQGEMKMQLIKCGTIDTLYDPIFYAKVDGKMETNNEIVKRYREYWLQHNEIKEEPSEEDELTIMQYREYWELY